jgi:hypothetical protein
MKAPDEYFELAGSPSTTQQRENTIEVSLRGVEQFFNTIDSSRFHEKDLGPRPGGIHRELGYGISTQ